MKKIGLVTFWKDNYGSCLQCYATKTYVKKLGYQCDLLIERNHGSEKLKRWVTEQGHKLYRSLRYPDYFRNFMEMRRVYKVGVSMVSSHSVELLDLFSYAVLQPKPIDYSLLRSDKVQSEYSFFIVGSDQVWSGSMPSFSPFSFLEFAPDKKKIALSPSFGTDNVKDFNVKSFRKALDKFPYLAAREDAGVRIIKELTGREAQRTADPVMLLTPEEWADFAVTGVRREKPYIFVHFLDKPSSHTLHTIQELAEKKRLEIICFAYTYDEWNQFTEHTFLDGGPYDYVSLISQAAFVCTDSFHTSHFSIIFNRAFLTFERNYTHKNKQSSRLQTLFSIYHCENRYIVGADCQLADLFLTPDNYDVIRDRERQNLIDYLGKSLPPAEYERPTSGLPNLKPEDECTGCMACGAICPKGAISFRSSAFGYRLPVVDKELCVHCGQCESVCRKDQHKGMEFQPLAYISYGKDENLAVKSASGGTFSALAKSIIQSGGVAVGARLICEESGARVEHTIVDNLEELPNILGSQYVESACSKIYKPLANLLKAGRTVLFCGTSCQVQAIYSYLGQRKISTSTLFTVDLICHGVPGEAFFRDYLKYLGKKHGGWVENFSFRHKSNGIIQYVESVLIRKENGSVKKISIPIGHSFYFLMFMGMESYRENCYHCQYACLEKPADITLGDYFEAKSDYPWLFASGGKLEHVPYISSVLVRNRHGQELVQKFGGDVHFLEVEAWRVQLSHEQLCVPGHYTARRFEAMDTYEKGGCQALQQMLYRWALNDKIVGKTVALGKKVLHRK